MSSRDAINEAARLMHERDYVRLIALLDQFLCAYFLGSDHLNEHAMRMAFDRAASVPQNAPQHLLFQGGEDPDALVRMTALLESLQGRLLFYATQCAPAVSARRASTWIEVGWKLYMELLYITPAELHHATAPFFRLLPHEALHSAMQVQDPHLWAAAYSVLSQPVVLDPRYDRRGSIGIKAARVKLCVPVERLPELRTWAVSAQLGRKPEQVRALNKLRVLIDEIVIVDPGAEASDAGR